MSNTKDIEINKDYLRQIVKERLQKISASDSFEKSKHLQSKIEQFLVNQSGVWGAFMPLKDEALVNWSLFKNTQFVFPKILGSRQMIFAEPGEMRSGPFGVSEPTGFEKDKADIQGFFVPGQAFTFQGERLGRGKGYYDRYLVDVVGIKVGVAFEEQIVEALPVEDHDVRMDFIITDQRVIHVGR